MSLACQSRRKEDLLTDPNDTAGLAFAQAEHDHRHCVAQALGQAEAICRARDVWKTPPYRES